MEAKTMKAAIISLENRDAESKAERIARVKRLIRQSGGADLYLLPELWNVGFFAYDAYAEAAEDFYGETMSQMADIAAEQNAYVFTGSFIERRGGKLYNTSALLSRNGEICGRYSKIHLFGREKEYLSRGADICVCDTEFGKTGLSICYDLRFPELYRAMADKGAELFLNCSAWPKSRFEHWRILNRARALENQAMWLSCCVSGTNNGTELCGVSYAAAPDGTVILETAAECETVKCDMATVTEYRREFPALKDRIL